MEDIVFGKGTSYQEMEKSQDTVRWRQFMEGVVSKRIIALQEDSVDMGECRLTLNKWTQGLVVQLLEVTHGQWLYRNVIVHDATTGVTATAMNEEILQYIKD